MKKTSVWANHHKWPARFVIIGGFVLLNFLGIITGMLFRDIQLVFPLVILYLSAAIAITGLIFYPSKKLKGNVSANIFYLRQKACDFLLIFSTYLMITCLSNRPGAISINAWFPGVAIASSVISKDNVSKTNTSVAPFSEIIKEKMEDPLKWKERKKMMKKNIKGIRKAKGMSIALKIILIVLSIFVAVVLGAYLAVLVCSIACSGAEALAIVTAILGYGLLAFLLTTAIKGIIGKNKKRKKETIKPAAE